MVATNILVADRVIDTTSTTGTGTLTLNNATPSGYQSFASGVGNLNGCPYEISDTTNGAWETGLGTFTLSGLTLSRDVILGSSNSGSAVSLASGTKNVLISYPSLWAAQRQSCIASTYNLKVQTNSVSPNTKVDILNGNLGSVYEVVLEDASTIPNTLRAVSSSTFTINTGTTGANGLDTGTLGASTWYYIYLIATPGGTLAGLMSTNSSTPTMPSGYTYKALLGAAVTTGSSIFQAAFVQLDKTVWIALQNVFTNKAVTTINTYQSQSLSTIVPPIAKSWSGIFGTSVTGNGAQLRVAGDVNGTGAKQLTVELAASSVFQTYFNAAPIDGVPLLTSQTFYWMALNTNAANRIDVTRWDY